MTRRTMASLVLAAAVMSSGCGVLEPRLPEAAPSIPAEWPLPATTAVPIAAEGATEASPGTPATADIGWRDFFVDPRLQEVIARALDNNRDLRVAVLNVERARAPVVLEHDHRPHTVVVRKEGPEHRDQQVRVAVAIDVHGLHVRGRGHRGHDQFREGAAGRLPDPRDLVP